MHVHDAKPCVMMESIKNVVVSDLVPCSSVGVEFLSECYLQTKVAEKTRTIIYYDGSTVSLME